MKFCAKLFGCLLLTALLLVLTGAVMAESTELSAQPNAQLEKPVVEVGSSYRAGEELSFPVTSDIPHNTSISWTLYQRMTAYAGEEPVNTGEIYYFQSFDQIYAAPYGLDAGEYRLEVYQYSNDNQYEDSEHVSCSFTVTGSRPAAPTVEVVSNHQLISRENKVWIIAEGLEAYVAESYFQYSWENAPHWNRVGGTGCGDAGRAMYSVSYAARTMPDKRQTVRFRGVINGCWSEYTGEVILTWYSKGQAAAPDVTVPAAFRAGEPIAVTVNDTLAGDEELYIKQDGRSFGSYYTRTGIQNGQLVLETYGRDAGSYQLTVTRRKEGYDESEEVTFTYEVTGERPAAPASGLSSTSIYGGESVTFTASAPGLEVMEFPVHDKQYMAVGGRAVGVTKPKWSGRINWRARIDGCWTDELQTDRVSVSNPDGGGLSAPVPHFENVTITVGQDFTFPMDVDSRTEILTVGIVQVIEEEEEDETETYYSWFREVEYEMVVEVVNGRVTIPGNRFTNPGLYRFNFSAYAEGYIGDYTEGYVVQAVAPSLPVHVSVDLNVGTSIGAYQDLPVTINAPGCTGAMLNVTFEDLEWGYTGHYYVNDQIAVSDGKAEVTIECLDPNCVYTFTARGYNSTGWSDWSQPQTLAVYDTAEAMDAFEITEYPEEIVSGEAFTVRWSACEGAERYKVYYSTSDSAAISGEVMVPGTQTWADVTIHQIPHQVQMDYDIHLYVTALAAGYDPYSTDEVRIELLGSTKPTVTASKTALACGESVTLTVEGSRARDLRLKINGVEKGHIAYDAPNGTGSIALSFDAEGTYQVQAATRDHISDYRYGIWSNWSDPVTLSVIPGVGAEVTLILPAGLQTIDEEAFMGVDAVRVVIPSGCVKLRDRAFAGCPRLAQVVIPESVTTIEGDPFEGCGELVIITPEGSTAWNTYIGRYAVATE